jgi:hypothetical protein
MRRTWVLWVLAGVSCHAAEPTWRCSPQEAEGAPSLEVLVHWDLTAETLRSQIATTLLALDTKEAELTRLENEVRRLQKMLAVARRGPIERRPSGRLTPQIVGIREDFLVLSVGEDKGLKPGMSFRVVRGDKYLGEIQVGAVYRWMSAFRIVHSVPGASIQNGFDALLPVGESRAVPEKKTVEIGETERGLLKIIGSKARSIGNQLTRLQQELTLLDAEIERVGSGSRPSEPKAVTVTGRVTAVREHFVEISAGKEEGVASGMVFIVRRGDRWLADATAVVVWQHQAGLVVAEPPGGVEIKKDDTVANKVP